MPAYFSLDALALLLFCIKDATKLRDQSLTTDTPSKF